MMKVTYEEIIQKIEGKGISKQEIEERIHPVEEYQPVQEIDLRDWKAKPYLWSLDYCCQNDIG